MAFKNLLVSSVLLLATTVASAALPPFHQSTRELVRLLQDQRLADTFTSGRWITGVNHTSKGYMVTSNRCSLMVGIRYLPLPDGMVGPARFEFDFSKQLVCK